MAAGLLVGPEAEVNAPKPRPPGLWHALARDAVLNPAEAAARDAVIAEHAARPPADAPPEPQAERAPAERLTSYRELIEQEGWRPRTTGDSRRARVEAFHPSGAMAMVTAGAEGAVRVYVLPARKGAPHWTEVHPMALAHWLHHQVLTESDVPRRPFTRCTCRKRRYPTEATALQAVVDATIRRVVKQRGLQGERRAYRCPLDDLVWHLTSLPEWPRPATPQKDTAQ